MYIASIAWHRLSRSPDGQVKLDIGDQESLVPDAVIEHDDTDADISAERDRLDAERAALRIEREEVERLKAAKK